MSMQTASSPVRPLAVGRKTTVTVPPDEPLIIIRRTFPAPAKLLFAALTQPEHVRAWYGCESMTMPECEIDLKVGGSFRYALADADGNIFGWSGTYLELDPPHGMVCTEVFDGFPDAVATVTVRLVEEGGHTTLTSTVRHLNMTYRDGHIASGMEPGVIETYNRLEALLRKLQ